MTLRRSRNRGLAQRFCWVLAIFAASLVSALGDSAFRFETSPLGSNRVQFRVPGSPNSYEILYGGSIPDRIADAVAMGAGGGLAVQLIVDLPPGAISWFYRVRRVPMETPLDSDGDGLDDVFEMRRMPSLNPLDPRDGAFDPDRDGVSSRDEYLFGTNPLARNRWRLRLSGLNDNADPQALDLSFLVSIDRGGFRLNRATGQFVQTVTIRNLRSAPLAGPLELLLGNLSADTVLYNADGSVTASGLGTEPYMSITLGPADVLPPGGTVTMTVEFTHPSRAGIAYEARAVQLITSEPLDIDADGLPDAWEALNGFGVTKKDHPRVGLSAGPLEAD